ncbi:hypothetical protein [Candidatus Agathobaculum pullicola]|uniref:hypothetical protein n=1 Tax=Candidatus Agathobaculum pullicola TaxID=2838426 RepID=UPI003F8F88AC
MIVGKNMLARQTSLRFSVYMQLALDGIAAVVFLFSWLASIKPYVVILGLMLLSLANTFLCGHYLLRDLKRHLPNEEYQRLAARYFPYGSHWLWVLLQYRQLRDVTGETGRLFLRIWLRTMGLIAGSMLGIYLLFLLLMFLL